MILGLILGGCQSNETEAGSPNEQDAIAFYAGQPSYLQPKLPKSMPEGLTDLSAQSCGTCHTEIYAEWAASTHSWAWKDAQFQAELHKKTPHGGEVSWMCLRCHTPSWNQLPQLVVDTSKGMDFAQTIPNPSFNAQLREEGVGCISCHLGDGVILGPTGEGNAPHPVQKSADFLKPSLCNNCHQAEAHFPEQNLACFFSTGKEHASSPQGQAGESCQDCHMPLVERPAALGAPSRQTRRHFFGGSLIPKSSAHAEAMSQLASDFPHGMSLSISEDMEAKLLRIVYENTHAGHSLPSGDPERFILIRVVLSDEQGQIVDSREIKVGAVYQWYPTIELRSDNRLAPLEKRSIDLDLSHHRSGAYTLMVEAEKWRITEDNLAYHQLEGVVPPKIVFYKKSEKITIR